MNMTGKVHLGIGAVLGMVTAASFTTTLEDAAIIVGIAMFSALVPDIDGNSLLVSKLNNVVTFLRLVLLYGGFGFACWLGYNYYITNEIDQAYAGIAISAILVGSLLNNKGPARNLMVSAIGVCMFYYGLVLDAWTFWLILLGLYIMVAPWLPHRGLTHSIWALLLWGLIAYLAEQEFGLEGIMKAAVAGYLSHLVADMFTAKGIKWLAPITDKAFKAPFW
jgi:inner membrane protein